MLGPQGFQPGVGGPPAGTGGPPGGGRMPTTGGPPLAFTPPTTRPGHPPAVSARLPEGARFTPGSVIHGQVAGREGGGYMLRLGEHMVKAKSTVPMQVGEMVQFRVQGEDQGQLHLQLVKSPFSQLKTSDLATNLSQLNIPASEGNMQLAKTMVEHGIPLTKENFQTMLSETALPQSGKAAAQMPPMQARVAAVTFLQQNQIPMTSQNVHTLSNFMANNPQIGNQLLAVNGELRKLARSTDGRALDLLKDFPAVVGELTLEPNLKSRGKSSAGSPSKKLFNMARNLGIETNLTAYGGGDDAWDLAREMRRFREEAEARGDHDLADLLAMLQGVEDNLEAHKLINQARPDLMGYYYLQVPFQLANGDTAEIWVRYYSEEDGSRVVDPEDTRLEFLVTTEHMGELSFALELRHGQVKVDVGTPSAQVREFCARYLPVLGERLSEMGWQPTQLEASYRPHQGRRELVEHTDFEQIQTCDLQA